MITTMTSYEYLGIETALMPPISPLRDIVEVPVDNTPPQHRNITKLRRAAVMRAKGHWREKHSTVMTSKSIPVDEEIAELVETLWTIGFETQFSCQGDVELFDETGSQENNTDSAHIIFPQIETAVLFMEYSYRYLIHARPDLPWASLVTLETMLPTLAIPSIRAIVRFNPAAIESLTEYWKTSIVTI
jgi:hypothetical protein